MDKRPIGLMDSGLGGLSVTRVLRQQMPAESVVFVGDQGHYPYGTKQQSQIQQLALAIGEFLVRQDVKLMIIACNTATAAALPLLQAKLPIPVIGVVQPGAQAAVKRGGRRIGVIGTESTINHQAYKQALNKLAPDLTVVSKATQPLVGLVEHGLTRTSKAQQVVNTELKIFDQQPVDTLILGCTHFPFLQTEIGTKLGPAVQLVDPAYETISQAQQLLAQHQQLAPTSQQPAIKLYSTGNQADLVQGAAKWLPYGYDSCEHLELGED